MLYPELKLKYLHDKNGYVLSVSGGHLAGSCEALEETGLVKIVDKKILPSGAIDYYVKDLLRNEMFPKPKTEFPIDWNEEKILKNLWEVYEHPSGPDIILNTKNMFVRNGIVDGFEMSILFQNKNQSEVTIKAVFPYKYAK